MTDPVIPYATPQDRRGYVAREVFGVVVRVLGLTMVLWGLYTLTYLVDGIGIGVSTRSAAQALGGFLVTEIFWLVGGLALLRGEWLVRFAYGGAAAG